MALYARYLIVRPISSVSIEGIKSYAENWLASEENNQPNDQFFIFSVDLKYKNISLGLGPRTRHVNQAGNDLAYFTVLDWSIPPVTKEDVEQIVDERLKNVKPGVTREDVIAIIQEWHTSDKHTVQPVEWQQLPDAVQNDIRDDATKEGVERLPPSDELADRVVALKNGTINVNPDFIAQQVRETIVDELLGEINIRQAQNDLVAAGIEIIAAQVTDLVTASQIGAFRTALAKMSSEQAQLAAKFEEGGRLEVAFL